MRWVPWYAKIRTLDLFGSHRGATGLLGLAGADLDQVDVGSCSGEEDENERPEFEGLIGLCSRDVRSAGGESCSAADTV